jgi:hypothetical protein
MKEMKDMSHDRKEYPADAWDNGRTYQKQLDQIKIDKLKEKSDMLKMTMDIFEDERDIAIMQRNKLELEIKELKKVK